MPIHTPSCSKEPPWAHIFPCPACSSGCPPPLLTPFHVATWNDWCFLYEGRGRLKEIKEESFTALTDALYLANHWAIPICENDIGEIHLHWDPSLAAMPVMLAAHWGTGQKWDWENTKDLGCVSEVLWHTPGDVWLIKMGDELRAKSGSEMHKFGFPSFYRKCRWENVDEWEHSSFWTSSTLVHCLRGELLQ